MRLVSDNEMVIRNPYWYPLRYHPVQSRGWLSQARFRMSPAGRRSGKTEIFGKRSLILKAFKGGRFDDWRGFAAAPTRDQAKRIYWSDLKKMIPKKLMRKQPSESKLVLYLWPNSEIHVLGLDRPERVEGSPWDHGILDEFDNMKEGTWEEHVRPALSDRNGTCDFIGVPEGRGKMYDLWKKALADDTGVWEGFHWKSSDILPASEIEQAKKDLDELVFQQEYEGSFVSFSGRCYYNFSEKNNVHKIRHLYDPNNTLIICFDFNVSPGIAVIAQEFTRYPIGYKINEDIAVPLNRKRGFTGVIGEVYIPRGSNTIRVCKKVIEDWGEHKGKVVLYGDSTGGATGSAKVMGSDWDLIEKELKPIFGNRLRFNIPLANPKERVRVNAVNSRISNVHGQSFFIVDGKYAPKTVIDFEGVRILKGSAGEIDKKKDPKLTHLSDSVGYYIAKMFPVREYLKNKTQYWK